MPLLWTIILQRSYELEWILGSSGSEGRPYMDLLLSNFLVAFLKQERVAWCKASAQEEACS